MQQKKTMGEKRKKKQKKKKIPKRGRWQKKKKMKKRKEKRQKRHAGIVTHSTFHQYLIKENYEKGNGQKQKQKN